MEELSDARFTEFLAMSEEQIVELMAAEQLARKQEFERQQTEAGSCYTPEFLEQIAREFDIDADQIPTLRQILSFAAHLYWERKTEQAQTRTQRQIKKQVSDVHKAVRRLRSALDRLSPEAASHLWARQRDVDWLALLTDSTKSPYGHTITRIRHGDAVELRYLRTHQLEEAVDVIGNLAAEARECVRRDIGGRPSDEALWIWVVNMQNMWEKVLGSKFTYDAHGGEGITQAFSFCRTVLRPLDRRVTGTQLGTVMRKAIKLSGRGKRLPEECRTR